VVVCEVPVGAIGVVEIDPPPPPVSPPKTVGASVVVDCGQSFGQLSDVSLLLQIASPQTNGYPQSTGQPFWFSSDWQTLSPQVPRKVVAWEQSFSQLMVVSPTLVSQIPLLLQEYVGAGVILVASEP